MALIYSYARFKLEIEIKILPNQSKVH